jgi:hypothetical protein
MEKPQMFAQSPVHPDNGEWLHPVARHVLQREPEIETPEAAADPVDDVLVRIADPQDALAIAALSVEDSSQKPGRPFRSGLRGPGDEAANPFHVRARVAANRTYDLSRPCSLLEQKLACMNLPVEQVLLRSLQRLRV